MNDSRLLKSINLTPAAQDALASQGYTRASELTNAQAHDLAEELSLSVDEVNEIRAQISSTPSAPSQSNKSVISSSQAVSASQLLSRPWTLPTISTLSSSVDALLPSRGVQPGMVVEIAGGPGVGKTSAAIGLAMDARRAAEARKINGEEEGKRGGDVLIVDTEGSISVGRLEEAAQTVADADPSLTVSASSLLRGIHLMRIHTLPQFVAFVMTLESYLEANPNISLVLIDTLSHPIRSPDLPPDGKSKARIVQSIKTALQKSSVLFEVAFVVTVQLATKFIDSEGKPCNFHSDATAILAPQLSELWMPAKTRRLLLFFGGGSPISPAMRRYATTLAPPNPNPKSFATLGSSFPSSQMYSSQPQRRGGWLAGSGMANSPKNGFATQGTDTGQEADDDQLWARFEISPRGLFTDVAPSTIEAEDD